MTHAKGRLRDLAFGNTIPLFVFAGGFLTLLALVQLMSCQHPLRGAYAEEAATSVEVTQRGSTYIITAYDDQGDPVGRYSQQNLYMDADGTKYRCVNPYVTFEPGTFTKVGTKGRLGDESIRRCALAQVWCLTNVSPDKADMVCQIFVWKILVAREDFSEDSDGAVDWSLTDVDIPETFERFETWYEENQSRWQTSGTYWESASAEGQDLMVFQAEQLPDEGGISLRKSSSAPSITDGNASYSLEGARYHVWLDEACTESACKDELTCDASGVTDTLRLPTGTYYVREEEAPGGYEVDEEVHAIEVKAGETLVMEVTDDPIVQRVEVWVRKEGIVGASRDEGSEGLSGAEFAISYYAATFKDDQIPEDAVPTRVWKVETDGEGNAVVGADMSGDDPYLMDEAIVCPLGTVSIRETKAPAGYWLEGQQDDSDEAYTAPVHVIAVDEGGTFATPTIKDAVMRGGIRIRKVDADSKGHAQGDASLAGITFDVIYAGETTVTTEAGSYAPHETITRITTDEEGFATTEDGLLPPGTYEVCESATNESMRQGDVSRTVTIEQSQVGTIVDAGTVSDEVIRGGVSVSKVSRETSNPVPQGAATLAGAEIAVILESEQGVYVDGALIEPGEMVCTLITDDEGRAATGEDLLPFGTYRLRELVAPEGYLVDDTWSPVVEIREDGRIVDVAMQQTFLADRVIRGGLRFTKVDHDTDLPMAGVPFRITSNTTGESHVIVSDRQGIVDTEAVAHSLRTNANDGLSSTEEAGIWFRGTDAFQVSPDDSVGALPYDSYTVEELPSDANQDKHLVSFDVFVSDEGATVDAGTIENETIIYPSLVTRLSVGDDATTFEDTVRYQNLEQGRSYLLRGSLVRLDGIADLERGLDAITSRDIIASASHSFTANSTSGTETVSFMVGTTDIEGQTLVAIEELVDDQGEVVCTHADLADEDQTVYVPSISTLLTDTVGNKEYHFDASASHITLIDTVTYENLDVRHAYTVTGTLCYPETGEPVYDEGGNVIRGKTTFMPKEANGSVEVTFQVTDPILVLGGSVVAFEELSQDDVCIASHRDLGDEDQTMRFPFLVTELTDRQGAHVVTGTGTVHLTDTVSYAGLVPGVTYEVFGTLMDKKSGEALKGTSGTISSLTSFKPERSQGTVTVSFEVDASALAGRTVVAFESLVRDSKEVACHEDIEDEDQTVRFPYLTTEMRDAKGSHTTQASNSLTLTDTVTYQGLDPNATYTIVGTLMDADTGSQISDASGKTVQKSAKLVPRTSDGTTEVSFTFDATKLSGRRIVAFEVLHEGDSSSGTTIATHADLKNESQTVTLSAQQQEVTPVPVTGTGESAQATVGTPAVAATPGTSATQPAAQTTATPATSLTASEASQATPNTSDPSSVIPSLAAVGCASVFVGAGTIMRVRQTRRGKPRHLHRRKRMSPRRSRPIPRHSA